MTNLCVICGKPYDGRGCNAMPVAKGQCCDRCDCLVVIPARMSLVTGQPVDTFVALAKELYAMTKFYKASMHKPKHHGNGQ